MTDGINMRGWREKERVKEKDKKESGTRKEERRALAGVDI